MQKQRRGARNIAPELKVLVSVDEAAELLSVGRSMLYALVRQQEIISIKVGRNRRIPMLALHQYIGRQLAQPGKE